MAGGGRDLGEPGQLAEQQHRVGDERHRGRGHRPPPHQGHQGQHRKVNYTAFSKIQQNSLKKNLGCLKKNYAQF